MPDVEWPSDDYAMVSRTEIEPSFPILSPPPKLVRHLIFAPDDKATLMALSLTKEDAAAVLACLSVMALDEREPERYREWYRDVKEKIEAQVYAS